MSKISREMARIENNIANSYDAVSDLGGTLPATQNTNNLADAIRSIGNSEFEHTSNKVTTITTSSTDVQYPSAKAVVDYFKEGNISPIATKTYTGLLASANTQEGADFVFADIVPKNTDDIWAVKFKVDAFFTRTNDSVKYTSSHIIELTGYGNAYTAYKNWNSIKNTSYRPVMYDFLYYNHPVKTHAMYMGISLNGAANSTVAGNGRTITVSLLTADNCTVTLHNSPANTDHATYYIGQSMASRTQFDMITNGLQETSDANNIDRHQDVYYRPYAGSQITSYKICLRGADNRIYPVTTTSGNGTSKAVQTEPLRPDEIWYYNSTTTTNAGAVVPAGTMYSSLPVTTTLLYSFNENSPAYTDLYLCGDLNSTTGLFTLATTNAQGQASITDYYRYVPNNLSTLNYNDYFISGRYYVLVGSTRENVGYCSIFETHPIYYYDGTNLISVVTQAQKVNGHTVEKDVPSDAKFTDTTYTFDGTYNASTNKAATVSTVTNAINALDGTVSGTPGSGKTLTAFSETDGKVSATFGDISITKSQISDLGTIGTAASKGVDTSISDGSTSTNLPTSKAVADYIESKGGGTVTTTGTMTANHVVVSNGGTVIKDSGFTIGKSVPSDAVFTDTTYQAATSTAAGLMSATDKRQADSLWLSVHGRTSTITDWNDVTEEGLYSANNAANAPYVSTSGGTVWFHGLCWRMAGNNNYWYQLLVRGNTNQIYMRRGNGSGGWTTWQRVDNTDGCKPNLLDNPFFLINQRDASGAGNNAFGVDRWKTSSTTSYTIDNNGIVMSSTGGNALITQKFEEIRYRKLAGKRIVFSAIIDGVTHAVTYTLPTTWPTASQTFGSSLAINNVYLRIYFTYSASGSTLDFGIISNAAVSNKRCTCCKVEIIDTSEVDYSTIARETPRPYVEELLRCQHYFYRIKTTYSTQILGVGYESANTQGAITLPIPVKMRVNPTVTYSGSFNVTDEKKTNLAISDLQFQYMTDSSVTFLLTFTGGTAKRVFQFATSDTGYIDLSADIA